MLEESTSKYINRISREYGIYTLDHRAIPAISDGLKTSQRIALWLMSKKQNKIKTMALSGEMIASELYYHGDSAASDMIGMLAAPYCNNNPLLTGEGSFGTRTSPVDGIAAPRYTYVKRSAFAQKVLYNDIPIVPMVENYDGSNTMPKHFLPIVPVVLLNGIAGIATAWSTKILPHKFDSLTKAVTEVLTTGKVQTPLIPSYDKFDVTVNKIDHNQYMITGKLERTNTTTVTVTELPPEVNLESFQERLNTLQEKGTITDYTNNSTKHIKVIVKFRRQDLAKYSDDELLSLLRVRSKVTERFVVLGWNGDTVHQYDTAEELVEDWVAWRLNWYLKRYQKLMDDAETTAIFWFYIISCFENGITEKLKVIKNKASLTEWVISCIKNDELPIDDVLIDRVINRPVYKWTQEGLDEANKELDTAEKLISEYESLVNSDVKRKNIFKKEIAAL